MAKEIVGSEQFKEEVLKANLPVFVDFWAPWCGPCNMVSPAIEEIGEENKEKMKTVKVNVDENQEVAARYQIQAIPTLILFKNGEIAERVTGAMSKDAIWSKIAPHLP